MGIFSFFLFNKKKQYLKMDGRSFKNNTSGDKKIN